MANASITIEGLNEALAALKAAGAASADLSRATRAAAEVVADESRRTAPVASGALRRSMSAEGRPRFGLVVADKPYAGPIHFGWSTRGLGRQLGVVSGRKGTALALTRQRQTGLALSTIRKAGRQARRGVRGGPIRPQPWIYEAWDRRQAAVFERFEAQLDGIERAFG